MRLILALALVLVFAPAAWADWPFELGIGEQQPQMFDDPRFVALELEHVRFVTAYDVACRPGADRASLDTRLAGARRTGSRPLVAFSFSAREGARWKLPSYRTFKRCFRAFRARYPWVRDFNPWNEANHSSQPTFRHPKKAAGFYNAMRRVCRSCSVAAGDLLDWDNIVRWYHRYRPHLRGRPRLWSIHNYIDVNRPRTWRASGTRKLLGLTRGELWITETSGVVVSRRYSKYDEQRAARATGGCSTSRAARRASRGCTRTSGRPPATPTAGTRGGSLERLGPTRVARRRRGDGAGAEAQPRAVEALDPPLSPAMHDTCKGARP